MQALATLSDLLRRNRRLRRRLCLSAATLFISLWLVLGFEVALLLLILFILLLLGTVAAQGRRTRPSEQEVLLARRLVAWRVERIAWILFTLAVIERVLDLLPNLARPFLALVSVVVALFLSVREVWVATARQMPMPWERLRLEREHAES